MTVSVCLTSQYSLLLLKYILYHHQSQLISLLNAFKTQNSINTQRQSLLPVKSGTAINSMRSEK